MNKDELLALLARHLTDNMGNRITQALANGLLLEIGRAIELAQPPAAETESVKE